MQFTQQETRTEPRLVMWAPEIGRQLYEILSFDKRKFKLQTQSVAANKFPIC